MRHMTEKGVTLIELMIAIAIISILAFALSFAYQGWMGRYNVESNVKQLYADLMDGRARAMDRNRAYFVDFLTTQSYRVVEDTNDNATDDDPPGTIPPGAPDTILPAFPKTLSYPVYAYSYDGTTMTAEVITIATVQPLIVFDKGGRISIPALLVDPTATTLNALGNPIVITGIISFTASSPTQTAGSYDYDCISISPTKISMGQMNGGFCIVK